MKTAILILLLAFPGLSSYRIELSINLLGHERTQAERKELEGYLTIKKERYCNTGYLIADKEEKKCACIPKDWIVGELELE